MPEKMILKLGGSVITDKSAGCMIREEILVHAAREIANRRRTDLVLIHGAGSCGHPEAKRYGIAEGVGLHNARGVPETHYAVRQLNDRVVGALRAAGIMAVGVHPLSAWCAENGELVSPDLTQVGCMLSLGLVPVLHGDVVMDRVRGGAIVSGDQLVRKCALGLSIRRVGLATDVPGVLCEGKVLPVVTPQIGEAVAGDSGHEDVTGGMRRKIAELLALAGEGISAEIFHISRLGDFLEGSPHGGTTVRSIE